MHSLPSPSTRTIALAGQRQRQGMRRRRRLSLPCTQHIAMCDWSSESSDCDWRGRGCNDDYINVHGAHNERELDRRKCGDSNGENTGKGGGSV